MTQPDAAETRNGARWSADWNSIILAVLISACVSSGSGTSALKRKVTALQRDITSLEARVDALQQELGTRPVRIAPLR